MREPKTSIPSLVQIRLFLVVLAVAVVSMMAQGIYFLYMMSVSITVHITMNNNRYNPEADRRKPAIRINPDLKREITKIAKTLRITECQALNDIVRAGLSIYLESQ